MKKFISFILCLIILIGVLPGTVEVHAEEETYRYYVTGLFSYLKHASRGYRGEFVNIDFNSDKKIAGYLVQGSDSCYINLYVFDDSSYKDIGQFLQNVSNYINYSTNISGSYITGNYEFDNVDIPSKEIFWWTEYELDIDIMGNFSWSTPNIKDSGYLSTNIPYFASEEECMKYISGEIDERSALNYASDISDIRYDLEVPKNIKIKDIQESLAPGYFLITWEQTDENYKNWQTEIYRYVDFKYRNSVLIFSWADWKYVDDYYVGQTIVETHKLSYKHRHMENVDDDELVDRITSQYPTEYGGVYKYGDEKIYMRNYYFDGQYRHYSNWIVLEFDPEEDAWINPNMNSSVVEKEGSELITDSSGVPIQPDSDLVIDSEYTGVINENYERVDGTDLISWIKSGFGIGGENGVLAIMKESFSFIPGEIWAVFVAGISLMVVVAVFKFIRG